MEGISAYKIGGSGPYTLDWHGGTGMFSVVGGSSGFQATNVVLQHDVSGDGQAAEWKSLGSDAEFTADGQTLFTTSANSIRVVFTGAGSEEYHIVVRPIYEKKAL
tara:strand:+ start:751 stop:1065 length:315 start_codon:yes stop_codon:yes gene_type:complete